MDDKDLDRLLSELPVPPKPSEDARKRALMAAREEFEKVKDQKVAVPSKGIAALPRLMSEAAKKLLSLGGNVMTRPAFVNTAIGLFVVVILGVLVTPAFREHRQTSIRKADGPSMPVGGTPGSVEAPGKRIEEMAERIMPATAEEDVTLGDQLEAKAPQIEMEPAFSSELRASAPESMPAQQPAMKAKKESRALVRQKAAAPMGFAGRGIAAMDAVAPSDYTGRPMSQEYVGRDNFEEFEPNPVKLVSEAPVSTFSIDVDTASYAFVRRALNNGYIPPKDSIRVEEMINYFDYAYEAPSDRKRPFKPTVAVYPSPWNKGRKLLHIGIKGHEAKRFAKPRSNLVFLMDVSGSMGQPDKLPLLKNSFRMLVDNLDADDSVAMVVYAGAAGTVLEPTRVEKKGKILAALDKLSAGGSTAGGEGIRLAYALAEQNFEPGAVNRVILATDGDFNVGIREPGALQSFIEKQRNKGIFLSVLGFGQGNYNDALMQKLAQNGNGNAAYIDSLNEARKVLVDEASSTLFTIAKDVKIQVEFNPARVSEYRLIGYETRMLRREDFNNDKVDAGEIGSGHAVTAIYEITPVGSDARLVDDLKYGGKPASTADIAGSKEFGHLKIRYKLPNEDTSRLIERAIGPKDEYASVDKAMGDMRFAASVAAFGQILRGGVHTGEFGYDDVISLARPALGDDEFGYRAEFLNLVRLAKSARAMGQR
jgi:Ca-activated chloride channel family protein